MSDAEINIVQVIINCISTILEKIFSSIDNNIYQTLDDITFINSDIMNNSKLETLLGSASSGIILIANSLVIGFLLYYAASFLISHITLHQTQKPSQFVFKLLILTIVMNNSYFICNEIITFNYYISNSIREVGENILNKNICFSNLITELNSIIYIEENSISLFSIDGILKSIISIGFLNLIFTYSLRYIMIQAFVLISPFAILSLSLSSTSNLFKSWLKSFLSLLFIQILVSVILLLIFSIEFDSNNLFSKFLYIGAIYALIRANIYVKEIVGGITTTLNLNKRIY